MASNDSISKTFIVALALCIVCSVVVSTAAVSLRPAQIANKQLDFRRNILAAAGMLEKGVPVKEQFEQIKTRIIDLRTGKFTDAVDPETFEQVPSAKNPKMSKDIPGDQDIAGLGRREDYAEVYIVESADGSIEKIILPIRGYGLWSTLKGFIALKSDLNTVIGLGYYEHGETPGLGGEVDNPRWKAIWNGKEVYNEEGEVALSVVKGQVTPDMKNSEYKVDGLSGATLTSNGVDNMIEYWMGENGYRPFLKNLQRGEA